MDLTRFFLNPAANPLPASRVAWIGFYDMHERSAQITAQNPTTNSYTFGTAAVGIPIKVWIHLAGDAKDWTPYPVTLRCGSQTLTLKPTTGISEAFYLSMPAREPVPITTVAADAAIPDDDDDDPSPPSLLAGIWKVAIEDVHSGTWEGMAEVDHKGRNAVVRFLRPQSKEQVVLQSTGIQEVKPGEFVLQMAGAAPPWPTSLLPAAKPESNLAPPPPPAATLPHLEVAGDATEIEVSADAWSGTMPLRPLPTEPMKPTVEVRLRWATVHHELGPYLSAPSFQPRFQGYWQVPADPVSRLPLLQAGREAYFQRDDSNPDVAIQFGREAWMVPPKPLLQYYALTAYGPVAVERLFQGVSMVVEAVFSTPQEQTTSTIHVKFGAQDLELQAARDRYDYRRFTTDPFVPGSAAPGEVQP
jgi:hypothetical protein